MSYIPATGLLKVLSNLSDVNSVTTSRNNLSLGAAQVVAFGGIDLAGTGGNGHLYIPRQSPLSTVTATGLGIQCNNSDQAVFGTQAYSRCILDFSLLATSDKTFTFPNTTGTLALTSDISGKANSGANSDITSLTGLTGAISAPTSISLANGGVVRTTTTTAHTMALQGYDVDGAAYVDMLTITNSNTPTLALNAVGTIAIGASSGNITLGSVTNAVLVAGQLNLNAGADLTTSAGASDLDFSLSTGACTLPTGNVSWTGASTKTLALTSNAGNITISCTTSGTLSLGGLTQTLIRNNGSDRIVIGTTVAIAPSINFTASGSTQLNFASATGLWAMPTGAGSWAGASGATLGLAATAASMTLSTTTSGSIILDCAASGDVSIRNSGSTRFAAASTYHISAVGAASAPATVGFRWTGAAYTSLAASTEKNIAVFNLGQTVQFASGALTTQRTFLIQAPTYSFTGASTLTNAATLAIDAAPIAGTNATITNAYSLWVQAGITRLDGPLSLGASATIGFFGTAVATQQASGANLTNNVTVGGTTDQIDNYSDLAIYANDAGTIRNDIYQLARKLKQVNDALRVYGILT